MLVFVFCETVIVASRPLSEVVIFTAPSRGAPEVFSSTRSVTSVSPASPEAGSIDSQSSQVDVHASADVIVKVSGVWASSENPNLFTRKLSAESFNPSRFWMTVTVSLFDPALMTNDPVRSPPVLFCSTVSSMLMSPASPEVAAGVIHLLSSATVIVQSLLVERYISAFSPVSSSPDFTTVISVGETESASTLSFCVTAMVRRVPPSPSKIMNPVRSLPVLFSSMSRKMRTRPRSPSLWVR